MSYRCLISCAAFLLVLAGLADTAQAKKPKKDLTAELPGSWSGKLRSKASSLEVGGEGGNESQDLTLTITLDGSALQITAVYATDEGPETFHLEGFAGNNNFWATGSDEDGSEHVTLAGRIAGKGKRIVGVGLETASDEASQLRFTAKHDETPPPAPGLAR